MTAPVCVCVCVCARARACACVRARVRASERTSVYTCMCACSRVCLHRRAHAFVSFKPGSVVNVISLTQKTSLILFRENAGNQIHAL